MRSLTSYSQQLGLAWHGAGGRIVPEFGNKTPAHPMPISAYFAESQSQPQLRGDQDNDRQEMVGVLGALWRSYEKARQPEGSVEDRLRSTPVAILGIKKPPRQGSNDAVHRKPGPDGTSAAYYAFDTVRGAMHRGGLKIKDMLVTVTAGADADASYATQMTFETDVTTPTQILLSLIERNAAASSDTIQTFMVYDTDGHATGRVVAVVSAVDKPGLVSVWLKNGKELTSVPLHLGLTESQIPLRSIATDVSNMVRLLPSEYDIADTGRLTIGSDGSIAFTTNEDKPVLLVPLLSPFDVMNT